MWKSVNPEHGPYRRPMGGARSTVPSAAAVRWTWPTLARHARRGQRSAVDLAHRRSLARSAESLSPYQTCHRRFQHWQRSEVLLQLLQKLAEDLRDRGKLDLSEAFVDASFSSAKKGALPSALLDAVRAAKSWRSATAMVFLSPCSWPALPPHETKLVEATSKSDSSPISPNG